MAGRAGDKRLGAGRRVHLHPGHGAEMLSATAGWPVGAGGAAAWPGYPRGALCGIAAQLPGAPAADVHGRRHLLHEGPAAPAVFPPAARRALEDPAIAPVLPAGRPPLGLPRRPHRDRRGDQRGGGILRRVSPGRFGAARQRGLRSRHRPPGPRAAPGPSRGIPRLPPQPAHARGGRHRAGRRLHPGGRAAEPADRPRGRLAFRRVLPPGRAGIHAGTGGRPADLRAAGEEPPLRLWRPVAGGGAPGARRVRRQRKPQTRSAAEGRAAGAGPGGAGTDRRAGPACRRGRPDRPVGDRADHCLHRRHRRTPDRPAPSRRPCRSLRCWWCSSRWSR